MKKEVVKIMLDFCVGPIWKSRFNEDYDLVTGIEAIDNDEVLMKLSDEINSLNNMNYRLKNNLPVYDLKAARKNKNKMLVLLNRLNLRLNEINDGTFIINDFETNRIMNL